MTERLETVWLNNAMSSAKDGVSAWWNDDPYFNKIRHTNKHYGPLAGAAEAIMQFGNAFGDMFSSVPSIPTAYQYRPSGQQGFNAPLAQPLNPNVMSGGVGGIQQPSSSFGSWFGDGFENSQVNKPIVGDPMNMSIAPNAMPQPVSSLSMFQDPATTPQSSTLDPNRFDAQMNTALAGMPKAAPANPWATGVDTTNALGEGIWGAGKGAPSGLNPVENGMGVAGYSQTDLDMMRALDPVMFEALTGATAKDTGWSQADTNMAVNAGLAGLNIYGMFSQLGQADRSLDIAQGNLDLKQDSFDETLRHRQALVNQNKMA